MNGAQIHLLLNHLPVLGVPFGLLLGAFGLARREDAVVKAALAVLVLAAVSAWATAWSGEGAEHTVERLVAGIDHASIHAHEQWADYAAWAAYAVGLLALAAVAASWGKPLRGNPLRRGLAAAAVGLALVPAGLLAYAAHLGGEIRHTELSGQAVAETPRAAPGDHRDG